MADNNPTVTFKFGEPENIPGAVQILIENTGIDLKIDSHKKAVNTACKTIGLILYSVAHNIDIDNIDFEIR